MFWFIYLERVVRFASKNECPHALFLHDFDATATLWSHFGQFFTIARLFTIIFGFFFNSDICCDIHSLISWIKVNENTTRATNANELMTSIGKIFKYYSSCTALIFRYLSNGKLVLFSFVKLIFWCCFHPSYPRKWKQKTVFT